jgi:hypothetical protein
LELRSKDGTGKGFITVRLSISGPTQAGVIAISNAREDMERSRIMKSTVTTGSGVVQDMGAAIGPVQESVGLEMMLGSVISKLNVFVQIIDKTSQVSCVTAVYVTVLTM